MSTTLTISYNLTLPKGVIVAESHPSAKTREFPISNGKSHGEYYEALRDAVLQAKTQIGADLTVWRDAVGNLENAKEPKKGQKEDDEDDDIGSEEQA